MEAGAGEPQAEAEPPNAVRGGITAAISKVLRRWFPGARSRTPTEPFDWEFSPPSDDRESRLSWWMNLTGRPQREIEYLLNLSNELYSLPQSEYITGIGYAPMPDWQPLTFIDAERLRTLPTRRPMAPGELKRALPLFRSGSFADAPDFFLWPTGLGRPLGGSAGPRLVGEAWAREFGSEGARIVRADGENRWRPGFLTAGHAFPSGIDAPVVKLPKRRLMRQAEALLGQQWAPRIGEVKNHQAPPNGAGEAAEPSFDFAVVDLDDIEVGDWRREDFVSSLTPAPLMLEKALRLTVESGVSGYTDHVSVTGVLMVAERRWRDCWVLGPSTALQKGDSGSAAYVFETNEAFGLVVGSVGMEGESHHLYVQSLERLMAESLTPNVRISERMKGK